VNVLFDLGGNLWVIRFGQGTHAVGQLLNAAADLFVVLEQEMKNMSIGRVPFIMTRAAATTVTSLHTMLRSSPAPRTAALVSAEPGPTLGPN
jgi:hypothetical protein